MLVIGAVDAREPVRSALWRNMGQDSDWLEGGGLAIAADSAMLRCAASAVARTKIIIAIEDAVTRVFFIVAAAT